MKQIRPVISALALSLCAMSFSLQAQTTTGPMSEDQIEAKHDADMKRCDAMKGNEKDVCEERADADRTAAKAAAEQSKNRAEDTREANKEKMDAEYDVAKEKCDAMSGDAKDACIAQAKTKFNK